MTHQLGSLAIAVASALHVLLLVGVVAWPLARRVRGVAEVLRDRQGVGAADRPMAPWLTPASGATLRRMPPGAPPPWQR